MKITIGTGLPAKRNMDINPGHTECYLINKGEVSSFTDEAEK